MTRQFHFGRTVQREFGDHWTFYIRLSRFVLEVNFGRDLAPNTHRASGGNE